MKYFISRIFFGSACFWATAVSASDFALTNCEGSLLASERRQEGAPTDLLIEVTTNGDIHGNLQLTLEKTTTRTPIQTSPVVGNKAAFSKLPPGSYQVCGPTGVQIAHATFGSMAGAKVTSFDLMAGLAVVGAGIGASEATRSGGSNTTSSPIELAATTPEVEDIQVDLPTGSSSEVAANKPCSKNKGVAGALGVNDCGAGLSPDPLSPYM